MTIDWNVSNLGSQSQNKVKPFGIEMSSNFWILLSLNVMETRLLTTFKTETNISGIKVHGMNVMLRYINDALVEWQSRLKGQKACSYSFF